MEKKASMNDAVPAHATSYVDRQCEPSKYVSWNIPPHAENWTLPPLGCPEVREDDGWTGVDSAAEARRDWRCDVEG